MHRPPDADAVTPWEQHLHEARVLLGLDALIVGPGPHFGPTSYLGMPLGSSENGIVAVDPRLGTLDPELADQRAAAITVERVTVIDHVHGTTEDVLLVQFPNA